MDPTTPPRLRAALPVLLAVGLLAVAPAQALFIATPLTLQPDKSHAQVGEKVTFTVDAYNETSQAAWKGKTVQARWHDASQESPGSGTPIRDVALDAKAHATFEWTVPEAARDKNVFVVLHSGEERLGQVHVRIGNAEEMAFITGGPSGGPVQEGEPVPDRQDSTTGNGTGTGKPGPQQRGAPGVGVLAALAGLGAVALLAARRKA
jgi:hypothetical protein